MAPTCGCNKITKLNENINLAFLSLIWYWHFLVARLGLDILQKYIIIQLWAIRFMKSDNNPSAVSRNKCKIN